MQPVNMLDLQTVMTGLNRKCLKHFCQKQKHSQFNSAQTIISNLHYNDAVQSYQKDVGGFPASVLGKLFGIQEVELFA